MVAIRARADDGLRRRPRRGLAVNEGKRWLAEQLIWEKRFDELRREVETETADALPVLIRARSVVISAPRASVVAHGNSFEAA